eukprot:1540286-Alexandrium_andersonii.AAC.1
MRVRSIWQDQSNTVPIPPQGCALVVRLDRWRPCPVPQIPIALATSPLSPARWRSRLRRPRCA